MKYGHIFKNGGTMKETEYKEFDRLTTPDGDYCKEICGMFNSCKRLKNGERRCRNALIYERLQKYENLGLLNQCN